MWSHDLKLQRAREHFDELEAEIDRWLHVDGCAITVAPDPKPPDYMVSAEILRPPDEGAVGILIGDCLQNARSALDHLAHTLGEIGSQTSHGREMTWEESIDSAFPIVGDERDGFSGRGHDLFTGAAARHLRALTPEALTFVERAQPFQDAPAWEYDGLWQLHELARIDRHRTLHLAVVRSGDLRLDPTRSSNIKVERIEVEGGPVWIKALTGNPEDEDSAVLARVRAHPADPNREMHMHFREALTIGWDQDTPVEGIEGFSVGDTLNGVLGRVGHVLSTAHPFLKWPEPPPRPPEDPPDLSGLPF